MQAEEQERLRKLYGSKDKWREAVEVFFRHIENRYLSELVSEGLLEISRKEVVSSIYSGVGAQEMNIRFGAIQIRLLPVFSPTKTSLGYINVHCASGRDLQDFFLCDLTEGWLAPARETGLRGLLRSYLPENLVPLNEQLFNDILCDAIELSEPIFTYDREKVLQRLSHLLDDLLDPSRKVAISQFITRVKALPAINSAKKLAGAAIRSGPLRIAGQKPGGPQLLPYQNDDKTGGKIIET